MTKPVFHLFVSALSFIAYSSGALAQDNMKSRISFELMHTKPSCAYEGKSSTWCTKDDTKDGNAKSGMVTRISELLEEYALKKVESAKAKGSTPSVYLAYFSFSNSGVKKKLCDVAKAGIPIEIVLDLASYGQADEVAACNKDPQNPNVKVSYLGGMTSSPWRLHHNKFTMINPGDGSDISINFSSGNLSSFGTSLHLDHWVMSKAPVESNLIKTHMCVIDGLRSAIAEAKKTGMYNGGVKPQFDQQVTNAYITARENCYVAKNVIPMTESDKALAAEGVSPSFSPNYNNEVFKVFGREIRRVTDLAKQGKPAFLYIAIQHFLHYPTMTALTEAADAGVDVRIVMDDDVIRGDSEVSGVGDFYEANLKYSKVKIRFAETNSMDRQMMHNKLAILNGKRSFSGAGHYTSAALRDNWENFYLIENEGLVKQYTQYFKELWEASLTEDAVHGGKNTPGVPLSPEALKLIGEAKK